LNGEQGQGGCNNQAGVYFADEAYAELGKWQDAMPDKCC
jgi:hypothetical protein